MNNKTKIVTIKYFVWCIEQIINGIYSSAMNVLEVIISTILYIIYLLLLGVEVLRFQNKIENEWKGNLIKWKGWKCFFNIQSAYLQKKENDRARRKTPICYSMINYCIQINPLRIWAIGGSNERYIMARNDFLSTVRCDIE